MLIWINLRECVKKNIYRTNNSTAFFSLLSKTADAMTAPFNLKRRTQGQTLFLYYIKLSTVKKNVCRYNNIGIMNPRAIENPAAYKTIHRWLYIYVNPMTGELISGQLITRGMYESIPFLAVGTFVGN